MKPALLIGAAILAVIGVAAIAFAATGGGDDDSAIAPTATATRPPTATATPPIENPPLPTAPGDEFAHPRRT